MVKNKAKMKVICINVSQETATFLDALIECGIAPSRSELMRKCLTDSMPNLFKMYEKRHVIVNDIKVSKNFLTPNDIIFVKDARGKKGYTKYQVLGEA